MAVTVNNGITNEPAALYSSSFQFSYATCSLKFWHTIYGFGSSLNVSVLVNNERKIPIFRKDSNSQETSWALATVKLG